MAEHRGVVVRVWASQEKTTAIPTFPSGGVSIDFREGHLLVRDVAWRVVAVYDLSVVESAYE